MRSLLWLVLASFIISSFISCRPQLGPEDPLLLRFEKDRYENLHRLRKLSEATGLRVLWWNVAWGHFNSEGDVDHNINDLITSNARPDILILGEFKESVLGASTHRSLQKHYPYQSFTSYQSDSEVGVKVYSTIQFQESQRFTLPWYPNHLDHKTQREEIKSYIGNWLSKANDEVKHWLRAFRVYTFKHAGINYRLVPVHLLSPYGAMNKVYSKDELISEFTFGNSNPLAYQIKSLRQKIYDYLGSWSKDPILLIGDFNVPKSLFSMTPTMYKVLAKGFTEAHFGNPDTFPTPSTASTVPGFLQHVSVKIDHALLNEKLERVGAWPIQLKGSDHYPIYVVVKPKETSLFGWF